MNTVTYQLCENMARGRGCLYEWSAALKAPRRGGQFSHILADEFCRPKFEIYAGIRAMGLPAPEFISMPLTEFASAPERYVLPLRSESFYLLLEDRQRPENRKAAGKLTRTAVIDLVRSTPGPDTCMVTVIEETASIIEGNVIVNPEGDLTAEFRPAGDPPLTRGGAQPVWTVESEKYTGTLRYSFENTALRTVIRELLNVVPYRPDDRCWIPGYYEISLCQRPSEPFSRAFVLDFREKWM